MSNQLCTPVAAEVCSVSKNQLNLEAFARIEAELARAATAERWAERDGWAEERDALQDALALLEIIPHLPRCGCGKVVHASPDEAARHVRLLALINDRGVRDPAYVYGDCPVRRHPGWHVGHRTYEPREAR